VAVSIPRKQDDRVASPILDTATIAQFQFFMVLRRRSLIYVKKPAGRCPRPRHPGTSTAIGQGAASSGNSASSTACLTAALAVSRVSKRT